MEFSRQTALAFANRLAIHATIPTLDSDLSSDLYAACALLRACVKYADGEKERANEARVMIDSAAKLEAKARKMFDDASRQTRDTRTLFLRLTKSPKKIVRKKGKTGQGTMWESFYSARIEDLKISPRVLNALKSYPIVCVGDLVQRRPTDLRRVPKIGKAALQEITTALGEFAKGQNLDLDWP